MHRLEDSGKSLQFWPYRGPNEEWQESDPSVLSLEKTPKDLDIGGCQG